MRIRNTLVVKASEIYCNFDNNKNRIPVGRTRFTNICSIVHKPSMQAISDHTLAGMPVRHYQNTSSPRPTFISTSTLDPFLDEVTLFTKKLKKPTYPIS